MRYHTENDKVLEGFPAKCLHDAQTAFSLGKGEPATFIIKMKIITV